MISATLLTTYRELILIGVVVKRMSVLPVLFLIAGYRFLLGRCYVEPYGGVGYPHAFSMGVMAGVTFGGNNYE